MSSGWMCTRKWVLGWREGKCHLWEASMLSRMSPNTMTLLFKFDRLFFQGVTQRNRVSKTCYLKMSLEESLRASLLTGVQYTRVLSAQGSCLASSIMRTETDICQMFSSSFAGNQQEDIPLNQYHNTTSQRKQIFIPCVSHSLPTATIYGIHP